MEEYTFNCPKSPGLRQYVWRMLLLLHHSSTSAFVELGFAIPTMMRSDVSVLDELWRIILILYYITYLAKFKATIEDTVMKRYLLLRIGKLSLPEWGENDPSRQQPVTWIKISYVYNIRKRGEEMKTGSYSPVAPHSLTCVCCLAGWLSTYLANSLTMVGLSIRKVEVTNWLQEEWMTWLCHSGIFPIIATKQSLYFPSGHLPTHSF